MKEKLTTAFSSFQGQLNKGHQRSVRAKKNILASILIKGGNIAVSLILVPLTIHYVNPTQYGIWITLSSIVGWFAFFDIGFGNGLRNKFAEAMAMGDHAIARIYLSTTYAILGIIILILLLIFFLVNPFLPWTSILNAPKEMAAELSILAMVVFVFFCLLFVLQLVSTIITANQQPAKASLIGFLGSLFSLLIIFILTKTTSGNLVYLALALGMTPVLILVGSSLWLYTRDYRAYAPSFKFVKFSYAKNLISLGLKFFIIQVAVVVLYETSNLIIAQLFGPKEVTSYNIAYKYFGIIPMLMSILMTPFWSAFTEAWVKQDVAWIRSTMNKLRKLWLFLLLVTATMLIASGLIYRLWVGAELVIPFSISSVLAVYVILNAWNGIHSQFINGVGKIKLQLYIALIGSLVNIPLAIFLGKALGIYGVVLSTVIISIVGAIISPIQYQKLINNSARGIWAK